MKPETILWLVVIGVVTALIVSWLLGGNRVFTPGGAMGGAGGATGSY